MSGLESQRLDIALVKRSLALTRSQAKSLIELGKVKVNGQITKKTSVQISENDQVEIEENHYVGRGAFKLKAALSEFDLSMADLILMDVGASTGGFTQVLLESGAQKVFAIDVGHDQLVNHLKNNPKVVNLERTHILELTHLPEKADAAVIDLSFISLSKVLPHLVKHFPLKWIIALIKPQFEVGKKYIGKGGIVRDKKAIQNVLENYRLIMKGVGYPEAGLISSPITGKEGNQEFLALYRSNR